MKDLLIRFRPSPALVISLVALFVAMGGTGYAVYRIGPKQLRTNAVTSKKIRKYAVTAKKLRKNSVTRSKIRKNAVTSEKVKHDSLVGSDILEASLRKVPDADKLDGQDSSAFESSARFLRVGTFNLGNGQTSTFLSAGPFSFTAKCTINAGGKDEALVVIATTQSNSAFDGDGGSLGIPSFGPATSEASRHFLEAQNLSTGDGFINHQTDGVAAAPDGTQLIGNLWAGTNLFGQSGRCQFGGLVMVV